MHLENRSKALLLSEYELARSLIHEVKSFKSDMRDRSWNEKYNNILEAGSKNNLHGEV